MADKVYLVVDNAGLHGAYFSRDRAEEVAENIEAAVAELPILVDHRPLDDRNLES